MSEAARRLHVLKHSDSPEHTTPHLPKEGRTMPLSKYPLDAINALTPSQVDFLKALPKAELHAHLNGSIPLRVLQQLAKEYVPPGTDSDSTISDIQSGIERLRDGVVLEDIHDFFTLFTAIYAITSTKAALARATEAVLAEFLDPIAGEEYPQATYLELRSTPRKTTAMTRLEYVETVLDQVEKYRLDQAALIVSVDRRMSKEVADECIEAAITLKNRGRRIVGVDICGHPNVSTSRTDSSGQRLILSQAGDMDHFKNHFSAVRAAGLGITVHIAEVRTLSSCLREFVCSKRVSFQTIENTPEDTLKLLSFKPTRLGHATFLNDEARAIVIREKTPIEICLTSNFL